MSFTCSICIEKISQIDVAVAAGKCGHVFHDNCITIWLKSKKICPECRAPVRVIDKFRIYLNYASLENATTDPEDLMQKVDDQAFKIRQLESDTRKTEEEREKALKDRDNALAVSTKLNYEVAGWKTKYNVVCEELRMMRQSNKALNHVESENKKLRDQMAGFTAMEELMRATTGEVEQMINSERDIRVYGTMIVSLKRELHATTQKLKESRQSTVAMQHDYHREKQLRLSLEAKVKELEAELYQKREQSPNNVSATEKTSNVPSLEPHPTKLRRFSLNPRPALASIDGGGLGTPDAVHKIVNSQSPYLPVQSSNIGLAPLQRKGSEKHKAKDGPSELPTFGILTKRPRLLAKPLFKAEYQSNGMGGSEKKENSMFPKKFGTKTLSLRKDGLKTLNVNVNVECNIEID